MSTPPAPTGPPGSWAKAAAGGGYGKSSGGGSSGEGSSPYGGKGSGKAPVVPKATAAQTRAGVTLLQIATDLLDQANTRIQHQANVIDVLANRVIDLEDQLAVREP